MKQQIKINIIQNCVVVSTRPFDNKAEAKKYYYRNLEKDTQYTQLVVNHRPYTIAEASRFFGVRGEKMQMQPFYGKNHGNS